MGGRGPVGGVTGPTPPAAVPAPVPAGPPALSVVVPAWNEAAFIAECLEALSQRLRGLAAEVIVVDDGSGDATGDEVEAWCALHPGARVRLLRRPHRGKGAAVYAGALASRGEAVAYIDADLEVPAEALAALWEARARRGLDVVVARRRAPARGAAAAARRGPWARVALSRGFAWLARVLVRLPVRDTQTGAKLFDGAWLRQAARQGRIRGFLFDVELLLAAAGDGLRLGEVEVEVRCRRGANRVGPAELARSLGELLAVVGACWHRRGTGPARAARVGQAAPPGHRAAPWAGGARARG